MKSYILYCHLNKINNKRYIGITCQKPETRYGKDGKNYIGCPLFYNAIKKYGWNNFEHIIILNNLTKELACKLEIEYIQLYKTNNIDFGYNISKGGEGGDSEVIRKKWENAEYKQDMKNRMIESWKDETKRKNRSIQAKERWKTDEYRNKVIEKVISVCKHPVLCIETGEIFDTIQEAANKYNVSHCNITRSCKQGYACGKLHYKYLDDVS